MENITFVPGWGVWFFGVLLVFLLTTIFRLKKQARTLEARADAIEEIQAARRKGRVV